MMTRLALCLVSRDSYGTAAEYGSFETKSGCRCYRFDGLTAYNNQRSGGWRRNGHCSVEN